MKRYAVLHHAEPLTRSIGKSVRAFSVPVPRLSVEELTDKAATDLQRDPRVQVATPTMPIRLIAPLSHSSVSGGDSWGIAAVKADASTRTGDGVTVAVLDTGIDRSHSAFAGVDLVERDFSGDGDGDVHGHGTHCAGTIFGRDVDGVRIGLARGVGRALIGKVLRDDGSGESDMIFEAMTWALQSRVQVISMSLGFDFPGLVGQMINDGWPAELATSTALEAYTGNLRMFDAIMGVMRAQQPFGGSPIVVAASGNESLRDQRSDFKIAASLPAAADGVVSVGAVRARENGFDIASFSNTRPVLVAPGVDIVSAAAGGGLVAMSGTSMACPHVAGVAALWWQAIAGGQVRPSSTSVTARLISSARSDVFASGLDSADTGEGMLTAPA